MNPTHCSLSTLEPHLAEKKVAPSRRRAEEGLQTNKETNSQGNKRAGPLREFRSLKPLGTLTVHTAIIDIIW